MASGPRFDNTVGFTAPIDNNSSSFHAELFDSISDGVYFVDVERKITYWNTGAERLTGYSAREVVGRHCHDNLLAHVDAAGRSLCIDGCPLTSTIRDGQSREAEIFLRHKLGRRIPVCVKVAPITDQFGQIVGAVEVFSDATAKKQVERRVQELEDLAFRDSLTHLPNRRYIELKVKQALEEFQEFGRSVALLMVDIDRFKRVNDRQGHYAGDTVLAARGASLDS